MGFALSYLDFVKYLNQYSDYFNFDALTEHGEERMLYRVGFALFVFLYFWRPADIFFFKYSLKRAHYVNIYLLHG